MNGFTNLKITAKMVSGVSFVDPLRLDCILSAAKAKEILQTDYYINGKQAGDGELVIKTLSEFLEYDPVSKVFKASCGFVDSDREFCTSFTKRWRGSRDEIVKFVGKGKAEIDTARGSFKSYHRNIIYRPCNTVTFYARGFGDMISDLLNNHIAYIGKKSSQGFGEIKEWIVEEIDEDYSFFKDGQPSRPLPLSAFPFYKDDGLIKDAALIPPAWRNDYRDKCVYAIKGEKMCDS